MPSPQFVTTHSKPSALARSLVVSVFPVPAGPAGAPPKNIDRALEDKPKSKAKLGLDLCQVGNKTTNEPLGTKNFNCECLLYCLCGNEVRRISLISNILALTLGDSRKRQ